MFFGQSLKEFSHGPAFSTLGLLQSPAYTADAVQQLTVVQKFLIRFGALHNNFRFSVHRENGRLTGLLKPADVVLGIALKIAQGMDIGDMEGHALNLHAIACLHKTGTVVM